MNLSEFQHNEMGRCMWTNVLRSDGGEEPYTGTVPKAVERREFG